MLHTYIYKKELQRNINKTFKKKYGYLNRNMFLNFRGLGAWIEHISSTCNFVYLICMYIGTILEGKTEKNTKSKCV